MLNAYSGDSGPDKRECHGGTVVVHWIDDAAMQISREDRHTVYCLFCMASKRCQILHDVENTVAFLSPDMCDACLNHFHMKKEEAVYIGDSEVDLQTAENSQLDCIVCAWGYRTLASLQEHGAKHIISEVKDLLQIFV